MLSLLHCFSHLLFLNPLTVYLSTSTFLTVIKMQMVASYIIILITDPEDHLQSSMFESGPANQILKCVLSCEKKEKKKKPMLDHPVDPKLFNQHRTLI